MRFISATEEDANVGSPSTSFKTFKVRFKNPKFWHNIHMDVAND